VQLSGNTILITGRTSGIGLDLAMRLVALDNTVIVTARSRSSSTQPERCSQSHAGAGRQLGLRRGVVRCDAADIPT
jgi:short-subunit dehydrogenase involved in D-alanine esterification of teichoic acids